MNSPTRIPLTVLQCHGRWWMFLASIAALSLPLGWWRTESALNKIQEQNQELARLQERLGLVELVQTTPPHQVPAPQIPAAAAAPATQLPLPQTVLSAPAPTPPPAPAPPRPEGAISLRGLSQSEIRSLLGQPTHVKGRAWLWSQYQEGRTLRVEFQRGHVTTWGWNTAGR